MLKLVIFILLIALIASLSTGFYFLVKDQGDKAKKRLYYALGIRVSLATLLMGTVAYGIASGQIGSRAPWDQELHPERLRVPTTTVPTTE